MITAFSDDLLINQDTEWFDFVKLLKQFIPRFNRFLIAESYGISHEIRDKYYKSGSIPFNFALIQYLNKSCTALCMRDVIQDSLGGLNSNWPNFVVGKMY